LCYAAPGLPVQWAQRLKRVFAIDIETCSDCGGTLTGLIGKHEQHWPYYTAAVLAYRGEADRAFAWLDKAVAYGDPALSFIAGETWFSNLYEDPRWLPFLERIGRSPAQLDAIEFEVKLPE
jgi:hypothetical protein